MIKKLEIKKRSGNNKLIIVTNGALEIQRNLGSPFFSLALVAYFFQLPSRSQRSQRSLALSSEGRAEINPRSFVFVAAQRRGAACLDGFVGRMIG
jgi:hypothetical protein